MKFKRPNGHWAANAIPKTTRITQCRLVKQAKNLIKRRDAIVMKLIIYEKILEEEYYKEMRHNSAANEHNITQEDIC
jgi:hypothetical protein